MRATPTWFFSGWTSSASSVPIAARIEHFGRPAKRWQVNPALGEARKSLAESAESAESPGACRP
jgi:hypothetical protein